MAEEKLKEKVSMPVCPYCKTEMEPVEYVGYDESISCWFCECDEIPSATEFQGINTGSCT